MLEEEVYVERKFSGVFLIKQSKMKLLSVMGELNECDGQ